MRIIFATIAAIVALTKTSYAQSVDYSVVLVPEESGTEITCITDQGDYVCLPLVKRSRNGINWFSNRILDISKNGKEIAYLSARDNTTNIYIKELGKQGGSVQRTNRAAVMDFSYSPDGGKITFCERRGNTNQVFLTDARNGYTCRQITNAALDYSPIYSSDMSQIFFTRQERRGTCIWSYSVEEKFLTAHTPGMNPYPITGEDAYICVRTNAQSQPEIWKVNNKTGVEECIVSDPTRGFTSPVVSPDGLWMAFVGSSMIEHEGSRYWNTDIYAARLDGTSMTQLTYHAADDLSPVWSRDGKYIYFISQRGNPEGTANIWRMIFNH